MTTTATTGGTPTSPDAPTAASHADDSGRSSLLRNNLVVATGTALSRITGLARVAAFGYVIGQTALADAYRIGNETPNIVYEVLLGGVVSATFVPLFTRFKEDDDEESTDIVVTLAMVGLFIVTVIAFLAAPLIFRLYTLDPADGIDVAQFREAGTLLTRIFLLQIFFYGATGVANALLQSRRRFFAAAWSPIVANIVIIASLLSIPAAGEREFTVGDLLSDGRLRWTLGLGATLGIVAMALVLIPAIKRAGIRIRPRLQWRNPVVRRVLVMSGWTVGYVAANQVSGIIVRNLADPGSGNAAAYFDAFTFFIFPYGLLGVSIATTFVPDLARAVVRRDRPAFLGQSSLGLRMTALLTLPAGVLILVLRRPIIGAFLQHGQYEPADALDTSNALGGFALGLVGLSVYVFALRGFYAHQDTRTPFVINVVENIINIVLAVALVGRFGVLGLGLAFALAYLITSVWAIQVLSYKVSGFPVVEVFTSFGRMIVAGALAGEVAWFVADQMGNDAGSDVGTTALLRVVVASLVGIVAYVGVLLALHAPELAIVRSKLSRRRA
ncbi:MAG: murein biosynthesis integral membrane protein MurJ [Ilumatobacteraceae bacterium]